MPAKMTASAAMTARLDALPAYVRNELSVLPDLLNAAADLSSAEAAATILGLLGDAQFYGLPAPPAGQPQFPQSHLMHLDLSNEWYWLSANLTASDGVTRIGVLVDMHSWRMLSQAVQAQAGWTDEECQVVNNAVTVVIANAEGSRIVRRAPNTCWKIGGDAVVFPTPQAFIFRCGEDVLTGGSNQVLPLRAQINDGERLVLDLTFSTDMAAKDAFFLQGFSGVTPAPRAGVYYSWPQLTVRGSVQVDGQAYEVSGTGWIDHQLIMAPPPADAPPPPTPVPKFPLNETSEQFGDWQWCQFNFDNGDAYTGVTFQGGPFRVDLASPYGYYLRRQDGAWNTELVVGSWSLDAFIATLFGVVQPTAWTMNAASLVSAGQPFDVNLTIMPQPWHPDGSFVLGDQSIASEVPVTVAAINRQIPGQLPGGIMTGTGYCETVGAEIRANYQARALAFLASQPPRPVD